MNLGLSIRYKTPYQKSEHSILNHANIINAKSESDKNLEICFPAYLPKCIILKKDEKITKSNSNAVTNLCTFHFVLAIFAAIAALLK